MPPKTAARSLVQDGFTGSLVCDACGAVQQFDSFERCICSVTALQEAKLGARDLGFCVLHPS
uniref:Uncharacterized protein n=1 Tax=Rhizophora mucronata TaxID=61149 RepID=A0A2P2NHH6_RHIMU